MPESGKQKERYEGNEAVPKREDVEGKGEEEPRFAPILG
jgi:hypothetical protein